MKRLAVGLAVMLLASSVAKEICKCEEEELHCSCSCHGDEGRINLEKQLEQVNVSIGSCKSFSLNIMNAVVKYLSSGLFSGLGTLEIFNFVTKNSTIYILGPHVEEYNPFKELNFKRGVIQVWGASSLNGWRWKKFQGLNPQEGGTFHLLAVDSLLSYLPSEFQFVTKNLTSVHLCGCQLNWLAEDVFAPFASLKILELRRNNLKVIKRSHLPESEDNELMTLDLGENRFTSIDPNFFDDFKKLEYVMLDNNPGLKVLHHGVSNQMPETLKDFYLNCEFDCKEWTEIEKIFSLKGVNYMCVSLSIQELKTHEEKECRSGTKE